MIVLENLTKRFGPKILFEKVSLQFDPGKRYGLTGANGAGKSTLIKMLGGEEDSDVGRRWQRCNAGSQCYAGPYARFF